MDPMPADAVARLFIAESRTLLRDEYLPRIERAVATLDEADLWWRPNPASNAVGNLLLHVEGNLRQYLVHGVGGAADVRDRSAEFDARTGPDRASLLDALRTAVEEADGVLASLDPARLAGPLTVQGTPRTVLSAVYHAVEHFGMHTGQIILLVKARTGRDLGFYRVEGGLPRKAW